MQLGRTTVVSASFGLLLATTAGCIDVGDGPRSDRQPAHIVALETYEASIGTPIDVYGTNFPVEPSWNVELKFDGQFRDARTGRVENRSFRTPARVVDRGTIRWNTFGPYGNPFSSDPTRIGAFRGTVQVVAQNKLLGQSLPEDPTPMPFVFTVAPSLVVRELQPMHANCAAPAARGLAGFRYQMRVEALGFQPTAFTYKVTIPALANRSDNLRYNPLTVRHLARGTSDTLGGNTPELVFPDMPADLQTYDTVMEIEASDRNGEVRRASLVLGMHRPVEFYYNGFVKVAEVFAPTPVSACISGGTNGRHVSYSENMSETRTRSIDQRIDQHWSMSHSTSLSNSQTISTRNQVELSQSTTNMISWHSEHSRMIGGGGHAGLNIGVVSLGGNGMYSDTRSNGMSTSNATTNGMSVTNSTGIDRTEATTDTDEVSMGGGMSETLSMSVSSTRSIDRNFSGTVIAGHYGVFYRQTLRLIRPVALVEYNACGEADVRGDIFVTDWTWSPDLAQGTECPPLPQSNLPAAVCYEPPCSENPTAP